MRSLLVVTLSLSLTIRGRGFNYSFFYTKYSKLVSKSIFYINSSNSKFNISKSKLGLCLNLQYLNSKTSYVRVGITASKKLGNSVNRNFVKRRIRSLVQKVFSKTYVSVKDYVIVAKKGILSERFDSLHEELKVLLKKIEK